jgi:hypothetical protein
MTRGEAGHDATVNPSSWPPPTHLVEWRRVNAAGTEALPAPRPPLSD